MRIITITDSPNLCTGLARVHRHIIDALVEAGHQVLPCVWFGYDDLTLEKIKEKKIKAPTLSYTTPTDQQVPMITIPKWNKEFDDVKMLHEIIKMAKPDVVLTIGDHWDFYYMPLIKRKADYAFKWLAYLTIELDEIEEKYTSLLDYVDGFASPTDFGRTVLEPLVDKPVSTIPYGVEAVFKRLPNEERQRLREERDCADKIRFITVAQNTVRKNLPSLLQAIKLICHRDPNRRLQFYIHTNIEEGDFQDPNVYDLAALAAKLGIEDWVVFPESHQSVFNAPTDDNLLEEYNSADFFVTPSTCEGYGLPLQEAMACGLPVIANGYSVMPELVGPVLSEHSFGAAARGWLVGNRTEVIPPAKMIKVIRPDALGQAIWELSNWQDTSKMRENCLGFAKERSWSKMKERICKVVESVAGPISIPIEVLK